MVSSIISALIIFLSFSCDGTDPVSNNPVDNDPIKQQEDFASSTITVGTIFQYNELMWYKFTSTASAESHYSGFEATFGSSYVATLGWKYTKTGKNAATLVFKDAATDLSSSGGLIITSLTTHTYNLNFTGINKGDYQFTLVENSIVTDKGSGTFTLK
jgi:hypothetical protein